MLKVDKHPLARRDLVEIWHYTAERWGEEQAERYLRLIDAAIQQVRENPFLGSDAAQVRPGLRRFPAGQHRIFYLIGDRTIEIARVLHASMDFERHVPENEN